MKDRAVLQRYINNFRRHLAPRLKPGVGLASKAYPAEGPGAILEFTVGPGIANDDEFAPTSDTVNAALGSIRQKAFGGNLAGFAFRGTNTIAEGNRIIFIKGEDSDDAWSDSDAAERVNQLLVPRRGAPP